MERIKQQQEHPQTATTTPEEAKKLLFDGTNKKERLS